ncbi:hypothetical protein ACIQXW_06290 [Lysinibacillus sp. NPDC097162]|uniref:hypothetical protein n=1 Tax=Lysinibacillus sp. NPDC097162 TaxID=3364140 RepID=UPI00380546A1
MAEVYMQIEMERFIELKRAEEENIKLREANEKLTADLFQRIDYNGQIAKQNADLMSENRRLREALEFYAKNSNYLIEWSDKCDEYMPSVADNDGGEIARQALGGEAN